MNLRPRRRDDPELNLVPMIDVVLVLLIFFMIATSLRHESELEIRLPEASSGKSLPDSLASLEVSIDAAGHYSIHGIEGRLLDPTTDVAMLREGLLKASGGRELPLKISADGQTPHQAVVTVLEVAGQLGLRQVDIATMNAAPTIAPPPSATNSSPTP